ncbi:MAG: flagellar biosynthesis protein FlhB [Deltaproteobacteria bacterium RIFOXYD12_FULL_57_12]|nr:MAG: flagellar biosynthesis protein FlhB [Deltaproteobacteria bacterium RIFOXYD12_FULL_57_12]
MAEETQQERTEQATVKRRDDFRKKGQVAQSKEVHTAALLSFSMLLWFFYAPVFWHNLESLVAGLWQTAGEFEVTRVSTVHLAAFVTQKIGLLMAPILLLIVVVGFFSSFLQIGWIFTTTPLEPDFSKLDPIKGMQRFFSKRSLMEVLKSLAKVSLIAMVSYSTIRDNFVGALLLINLDLQETVLYLGRVSFLVMIKICGIMIMLGLVDFLFTRWEMEQKMKMTKQEQKEEFKESEGDPHIKARVRSIQHQMARKRMMAEVPKADVVITNPTHIAVALTYIRGEMNAPQVVAKGADHLALRIKEIAREHHVPIVENIPVARALHKVNIGAIIPEELFKAVAEILAYVYNLKGKTR